MAIFHMSFSNISAGKGRSAIAGASYRSGEKLFDQKEGRSYFYARSVMPESFILTPKNAPEWAND
ncbi:MobA/MobL family protein, partial [Oenococcus oeni]